MKIKKWKFRIFEGFQGGFLFLLGFPVGTVLPNLLWKMQWKQETVHVFYLLGAFAGEDVSGKEYFLQVLAQRGGWLFICMLCGFSVFGVPVSVLTMLGEGIKTGAILSMSILQFGFVGGAAGLALLFPHEIVYLIVFFYFMRQVYNLSLNCWKGRGLFPQGISGYCLGFLRWGILYMGGILLEIYVNPWFVKETVKFLDFF